MPPSLHQEESGDDLISRNSYQYRMQGLKSAFVYCACLVTSCNWLPPPPASSFVFWLDMIFGLVVSAFGWVALLAWASPMCALTGKDGKQWDVLEYMRKPFGVNLIRPDLVFPKGPDCGH